MAPSASPFPPKKLLITDPTPNSDPNPASSSSTTSAPPPEKRTRDQPKLSDCHCCGRRINYTNHKDRLQPLDSVWRIVLLCRRCRESLHSGQKCPYCFKETGNSGDLFTCRDCQRKIHRNCFRDYGNCTPWCYLGMGLEGFRVCVDCWVPDALKKSVRVPGRSEIKGGVKGKGEAGDLLENGVRDAKCRVEKKAKRVVKAKANVLRMANGDLNSVNLEDDGSDLSAEKDCLKAGNSNGSGAVEVVDGTKLASQLHRVKDSSPRNLRGMNSSIGIWKGYSYERSRFRNIWCEEKLETGDDGAENERVNQHMENDPSSIGLVPYKRDRSRKIWQLNNENVDLENLHLDDPRTSCLTKSGANTSADSICVNTDQQNGDKLGQQIVIYKRTRFKKKESEMSGTLAVSRDSSYCDGDGHGVAFRSDNSQPDDTNLSAGSPTKSDINVILASESCDTERDRYQMKYFKRVTDTKPCSHFPHFSSSLCVNQVAATAVSNTEAGGSVDNGKLILPNGTCDQETDRYSLKYAKRVKSSKSGSDFEGEVQSNAFLTMNCSAESRAVSDASGDCIGLPK